MHHYSCVSIILICSCLKQSVFRMYDPVCLLWQTYNDLFKLKKESDFDINKIFSQSFKVCVCVCVVRGWRPVAVDPPLDRKKYSCSITCTYYNNLSLCLFDCDGSTRFVTTIQNSWSTSSFNIHVYKYKRSSLENVFKHVTISLF